MAQESRDSALVFFWLVMGEKSWPLLGSCSAGDDAKGKVRERNPTEMGAEGDVALNPAP